MNKICYDCLETVNVTVYDKGFIVCQRCYHRRYSTKRHMKHVEKTRKNYTLKELKDYLEKNWS